MICHHSSFFATAFNNSKYAESDTQTMYLPDVSSDDFGVCVKWIYDQHIELDPLDHDPKIMIFARLWNLAKRFRISKLQNKIMDKLRALVEEAEKDVLKAFLDFVYKGTQDNAELRRLAADRMAWGTTQQCLGAWIKGGHLPVEMLEDIVLALKKDHIPGKPTVRHHFRDASEYYVDLAESKRDDTEES